MRQNRGDLDRLEHPVVQVALDPRQRRDHPRIPHAVAHPPAGHVVALRQGVELDPDLLRARHLQEAGRLVAVEPQIGVREIVHHHELVVLGEGDDMGRGEEVAEAAERVDRQQQPEHQLLRVGLIVRPVAGYGLPEYLRISIGLPRENDRLLRELPALLR